MSGLRKRFRELLAAPQIAAGAPVFDPLSARIAEMLGWDICKLSGSVGKFANLAVPDGLPISTLPDLVDICRRITRITDMCLVVDADDGGSPVTVRRTVRELESVGVCAIEIEDNVVPDRFMAKRHGLMISLEDNVAKLRAALDARQDPTTVIVGRSTALQSQSREEALERFRAYGEAGVDALMLPGLRSKENTADPRRDIEDVRSVTDVPLIVSDLPREVANDQEWISANRVALRFYGQAPFLMAVRAIVDSLEHLAAGGVAEELKEKWAAQEIVDRLTRVPELRAWEQKYSGD